MTASTLFSNIVRDAHRNGIALDRSRRSIEWFRERARDVRSINRSRMFDDSTRTVGTIEPGNMYSFFYDPKHKNTLPYYDRFPLVFPFSPAERGFLGINLHYLPYELRARLMDGLAEHINNDKLDKTTKLKINYGILKSAARLKYFEPCVKRYLDNHVRSQFVRIAPKEWEIAVFLPLQSFQNASVQQVWADSRRMIN